MSLPNNIVWDIEEPENFEKEFKRLGIEVRKAYFSRVSDLVASKDPRAFGILKITKYGPAYVVRLNDSFRLLYTVDFTNRLIQIVKIGDHKQVYGKD
jgi:mRNA-degrading endonuclease RelE of RelBE toxin-antitoxin system